MPAGCTGALARERARRRWSRRVSAASFSAAMRLVRATLAQMDAALAGDEALADALGHDVVPGWATIGGEG
jgi:hypothetical protein